MKTIEKRGLQVRQRGARPAALGSENLAWARPALSSALRPAHAKRRALARRPGRRTRSHNVGHCASQLSSLHNGPNLQNMAEEAGIDLWKLPYEDARPERLQWLAENAGNPPMAKNKRAMKVSGRSAGCRLLPVHNLVVRCVVCCAYGQEQAGHEGEGKSNLFEKSATRRSAQVVWQP